MKNIRLLKDSQLAGKPVAAGTVLENLDNSLAAPLLVAGNAELVIPAARVVIMPARLKPGGKRAGQAKAAGAGPAGKGGGAAAD